MIVRCESKRCAEAMQLYSSENPKKRMTIGEPNIVQYGLAAMLSSCSFRFWLSQGHAASLRIGDGPRLERVEYFKSIRVSQT